MSARALFIDRDGVINEDTGYPHKPEHIVFRPGIFDLCASARLKGYVLVVVTNQAGVGKGRFTEDDVRSLHAWMQEEFRRRGIEIAAFYYCPHHVNATLPEYRMACEDRKPRPGMILKAARDLDLDVSTSVMIGDKHSDRIELPGLKSIIIRSRYAETGYDVEALSQIEALL
jgi:D-glycero-D-manno-heptose 1,7-bisphosphate phosphatase